MIRNDPHIDRLYNYVYKITNIKNGKIYIGVHRTNNIDDGYMGSGVCIKRAIEKHGIDNFNKEIIQQFDTYIEALEYERDLVNIEFINRADTYNLREGGYGRCTWSDEAIKASSDAAKQRWKDPIYKDKMLRALASESRCKTISAKIKEYILKNPEAHSQKMRSINTDPIKIQKTAEKHRGAKRSEESKKLMSQSMIDRIKLSPDKYNNKGCKSIYNAETDEVKFIRDGTIPTGWVLGGKRKRDKSKYAGIHKGSVFAYNPDTLKVIRAKNRECVPSDFVLGKPSKCKKDG